MLKRFFPDAYAPDVFHIDYHALYDRGYRAILFDVDNTLVHHNADSTPEVDALFQRLHAIGFKTILVSNNSPARLERFLENIDAPYVSDAEKPQPRCYAEALRLLRADKAQSLFIGDQMFIDTYGANRFGMDNILVHYIVVDPKEPIGIRRHLERAILLVYRFRKRHHKLSFAIVRE